jgi:hypothetical protein
MATNATAHPEHIADSSPMSMVTGFLRQGTESFFATQRILLDLVMRQNSMTINAVRDAISFERPTPAFSLNELAGEGMSNFIAAQRILLNLVQQQNDLVLTGVKERISGSSTATAISEMLRRSVDTYVDMQQHVLTLAARQTEAWIDSAKTGEPFAGKGIGELAREAMETFVRSQKKFLDMVAEEVDKATNGSPAEVLERTELADLAKQASDSFIDAQKKMIELAGKQSDVTIKAAKTASGMIPPMPRIDLAHLTRETVDSYVTAQKALLDVMMRPQRRPEHGAPVAVPPVPIRKRAPASKSRRAKA